MPIHDLHLAHITLIKNFYYKCSVVKNPIRYIFQEGKSNKESNESESKLKNKRASGNFRYG